MRASIGRRLVFLRGAAIVLPSLIILSCLALQTFAVFRPVSPRLWPFLDYPMYGRARYEGEAVSRYVVFGIFADESEARIIPEDLDLDFWKFEYGPVQMLRRGDVESLKPYAQLYSDRQKKQLVRIRLENHPFMLSDQGVRAAAPQVLNSVSLEPVNTNGERQ
jgi:hypothetical protein